MNNICRICLCENTDLELVSANNLVHKITVLSQINITTADELPQKICFTCADTVNSYYVFREKVIENDKILREKVKKSTKKTLLYIKTDTAVYNSEMYDGEDSLSQHFDKDQNDTIEIDPTEQLEQPKTRSPSPVSNEIYNNSCIIKNNEEHVILKEGKLSFKCLKCKMEFKHAREAQKHEALYAPKLDCTICDRRIKKTYLRRHVKIYHLSKGEDIDAMVEKVLQEIAKTKDEPSSVARNKTQDILVSAIKIESDTLEKTLVNVKDKTISVDDQILNKSNSQPISEETDKLQIIAESSSTNTSIKDQASELETFVEHISEKDPETKMYKCQQCDFESKYKKDAHKHRCRYAKTINCPLCWWTMKEPNLRYHIRFRHPMHYASYELKETLSKEAIIPVNQEMDKDFSKIIDDHTQDIGSMNEEFTNKTQKSMTIVVHTVERNLVTNQYECSACDFVSPEDKNAREHQFKHEPKTNCPVCNSKMKTEYLKDHIRTYHPNETDALATAEKIIQEVINAKPLPLRSLICNLCNFTAKTRCEYLEHRQSHKSQIYCSLCQELMSKTRYSRHKKIHGSEVTVDGVLYYLCRRCEFRSTDEEEVKEHKKTHVKRVICNICGDSVTSYNIHGHMVAHKNLKVSCKVCSKVVKATALRRHMEMHIEQENTCKICGKTFTIKSAFSYHMAKHQKKPVTCQICNKLIKGTTMAKHMRSHTGERPYQCNYCDKQLSNATSLKGHIRLHTNEKPFTCNLCPKAFTQRVSLRTHMKSQHGVELPSTVMFT